MSNLRYLEINDSDGGSVELPLGRILNLGPGLTVSSAADGALIESDTTPGALDIPSYTGYNDDTDSATISLTVVNPSFSISPATLPLVPELTNNWGFGTAASAEQTPVAGIYDISAAVYLGTLSVALSSINYEVGYNDGTGFVPVVGSYRTGLALTGNAPVIITGHGVFPAGVLPLIRISSDGVAVNIGILFRIPGTTTPLTRLDMSLLSIN